MCTSYFWQQLNKIPPPLLPNSQVLLWTNFSETSYKYSAAGSGFWSWLHIFFNGALTHLYVMNSLPNDRILDQLQLKAYADGTIKGTDKLKFV